MLNFTIIHVVRSCVNGVAMFSKDLVAVTTSKIMEAIQWLDKKETLSVELTSNIVAAANEAINTEHVSIIIEGGVVLRSRSYTYLFYLPSLSQCHGTYM